LHLRPDSYRGRRTNQQQLENSIPVPRRILPRNVLEFRGLTSTQDLDRVPSFLSRCHLIPGDLTYETNGKGHYTFHRIKSGKCIGLTPPQRMGSGETARFRILAVEEQITPGHHEYDELLAAIKGTPAPASKEPTSTT
jgi:hypothetical protein